MKKVTVHTATPRQLLRLAKKVGYREDTSKGKGSHVRLYLEGYPPITLPCLTRKEMSRNAARDTLKKIQKAQAIQKKSKAA